MNFSWNTATPFVYVSSLAAFMIGWQICIVATDTLWPQSLKYLLFGTIQSLQTPDYEHRNRSSDNVFFFYEILVVRYCFTYKVIKSPVNPQLYRCLRTVFE